MQPQDATTLYFFKVWPWIEANKNRLIGGAVIIAAAIFLIYFFSWQREQREITAEKALTQLFVSVPSDTGAGQLADLYLQIAGKNPGTLAGRRALLQGATVLFDAGRYADAQIQFQKFLDAYPDNPFAAQAMLGVAASLDAQGKTDLAAGTYQHIINSFSDATCVNAAKFALARIDEAQGKFNEAFTYYADVAQHSNPNGSLGSEAVQHAMELRAKLPSTPSSTPAAPASSFKLSP
jgi:predicted negative regulator of RcsB-dependent stress response